MTRTVLIIDDTAAVRERLRDVLLASRLCSYVIEAKDGAEGFKQLTQGDVDVVLCDVVMPNLDGIKFLQLKEQSSEYDDVPVIMLTGQDDLDAKVSCLSLGAQDYLTKPFSEPELVARVKVHLQIRELQRELRQKNDRLEELVRTDALTGMASRLHFLRQLRDEIERAQRYATPLSYIMADVDHFKRINDRHGHLLGDQALKHVARLLRKQVRQPDVVGRYGGEEFGIVLPQTDAAGALLTAERCCSTVASTPLRTGDGPLQITLSMGVACYSSALDRTADDLIRRADRALYEAKNRGRNRVVAAATSTQA